MDSAVRYCGLVIIFLLTLVLAHASAQSPTPADRGTQPAPFGAEALVEKGSDLDQALRAGKWEQAEVLLVKKIEAAPQSVDLLKLLGRVFLADRRPLNAAIAFKKAEAITPLDNQSRYELAIAYLSMNHGDWARPELERLAHADPGNLLYQVPGSVGWTTIQASTRRPPSTSKPSSTPMTLS